MIARDVSDRLRVCVKAGGTDGVPVLLPPPISREHRARSNLLETMHSAGSAEAETPRETSDIEVNLEPEPEPEPEQPLGRLNSAQLRLSMRKMPVNPPEESYFSEPRITFLKCALERTLVRDLIGADPCMGRGQLYEDGWSCDCCRKAVHAKPAEELSVTRAHTMQLCLALARHLTLLDEMEEIECNLEGASSSSRDCPAMGTVMEEARECTKDITVLTGRSAAPEPMQVLQEGGRKPRLSLEQIEWAMLAVMGTEEAMRCGCAEAEVVYHGSSTETEHWQLRSVDKQFWDVCEACATDGAATCEMAWKVGGMTTLEQAREYDAGGSTEMLWKTAAESFALQAANVKAEKERQTDAGVSSSS